MKTYEAKLFKAKYQDKEFHVAGNLDGVIDFALPKGTKKLNTFQLTVEEALLLAYALIRAVGDLRENL